MRSKQSPPQLNLKSNKRDWLSLTLIALAYGGIIGVASLAEGANNWALRLAALPIVAALQNHLQILLHEGAHFHLHPRKKWNDVLADLFCAIPFLGLVRHYRYFHLRHHRHLLDVDRDPEIEFYTEQKHSFTKKSRLELAKLLLLDISGYHYFQFFISYNRYLIQQTKAGHMAKLSTQEWLLITLTAAILLAAVFHFNLLFGIFFYWLLPQPTLLFFFLKLQGYGEHSKRTATVEGCTFTHDLGVMTRFFIYPLNSDLHLEHHLNPSLPWYCLRQARSQFKNCSTYFLGANSILTTILLER